MPEGFFDAVDTMISRGDEAPARQRGASLFQNATCETCGLSTQCRTPKMEPTGQGRREILVVAEAPGEAEDLQGVQLIGESGQAVRGIMNEVGLDLDRDCWKTNAVCCRPPENAEPTALQIAACRKRLMAVVERYRPRVILALGKFAMDGLVGPRMTGRLSGLSMTDWEGCEIPDQELQCWVCPTWHPAYYLRSNNDPVIRRQMARTFHRALELTKAGFPSDNYVARCETVTDPGTAVKLLTSIRKTAEWIAFDYETTGKKPQREGHRIVSASVSTEGKYSWAFPMFPDPDFREAWQRLMISPRIGKVGHSIKFEALWTRVQLGYWPEGFRHCTMLGAHILHNRKRTNLKFHTYANFGVAGYDDAVDPYLEALKREEELYGANGFNAIGQAPVGDLLLYNALDSLFTGKLYLKQVEELREMGLSPGMDLFVESARRLAEAEFNGIVLDTQAVPQLHTELTDRMDRLQRRVLSMDELKKWDRPRAFRMSATDDLSHLLFDLLKYQPKTFTATGRPGADKNSMEEYDLPVVIKTLEWRKYKKARDTYLKQYAREAVDGVLHPFFNLHTVDTFRSSSDSPNFQNIPKRDKQIMRMIRSLLRPRPGNRLVEYDYKAIEVAIIACYNKDPELLRYVRDPASDMHRDTAGWLFLKPPADVGKDERQGAKNGFVFPTFYGSYWKNTSENLWTAMADDTREHLRSEGVKNQRAFAAHVEEVEDRFWNRFHTAYEWMNRTLTDYSKTGYIDLFTGFRCWGPMTRNQVINFRVQGTAFHCLLWTLCQVMGEMERTEMRSRMIGQIHDAMIGDVSPAEEDALDRLVWYWGTQRIVEHWPEIIVPLSIEKTRSAVDGTWAEMGDDRLLSASL